MMLREIRKNRNPQAKVTLIEVGQIVEKLMGGAYRAHYCRRKFKHAYYTQTTRKEYAVSVNATSQK